MLPIDEDIAVKSLKLNLALALTLWDWKEDAQYTEKVINFLWNSNDTHG